MKRVFLSFKMEDKKQVDGVRLIAWNPNIPLEFYDESVRMAYKSENAGYVKGKIREKIGRCSVALGLLGIHTHESEWVNWELETAKILGKKIVLMGLPNGPQRLVLPNAVRHLDWFLWNVNELNRQIG